MKLFIFYTFLGIAITMSSAQSTANVTYSVIAFPEDPQQVVVIIDNQSYPLEQSCHSKYVFEGSAPFGQEYNYALQADSGNVLESTARQLSTGATETGYEFFNRSQTVYDIAPFPQAYPPIYQSFQSPLGTNNEIATIILEANSTSLAQILQKPNKKFSPAEVYKMTYITSKKIFKFHDAGINTSGQSSKDYAKQSLKIKLNAYSKENGKDKRKDNNDELLYNRKSFKLRSEATDPTMMKEKLMFDCLEASGAVTLQGQWTRLFINNEPYGLYLLTDDSSKHFTDNLLYDGNMSYPFDGATYKGNALDDKIEGNFVYHGTDLKPYHVDDCYFLEGAGSDKSVNDTNFMGPLIDFMYQLNQTVANPENVTAFIDSDQNTITHLAMSFLSGSWDGIWMQASNYYITQNLDSQKWYIITYDFDEVFGGDMDQLYMMTTPYQNYSRQGSQRPLVDIFVNSPKYAPIFQSTVKTIVTKFFNPAVLKPRLDSWYAMLKEDVAWDQSIPPRAHGIQTNYTMADFDNVYNTVFTYVNFSTVGIMEFINNRTTSVGEQLNFTFPSL